MLNFTALDENRPLYLENRLIVFDFVFYGKRACRCKSMILWDCCEICHPRPLCPGFTQLQLIFPGGHVFTAWMSSRKNNRCPITLVFRRRHDSSHTGADGLRDESRMRRSVIMWLQTSYIPLLIKNLIGPDIISFWMWTILHSFTFIFYTFNIAFWKYTSGFEMLCGSASWANRNTGGKSIKPSKTGLLQEWMKSILKAEMLRVCQRVCGHSHLYI